MAIAKQDLELLEQNGWIDIPGHLPYSAFSLDIRLGELYLRNDAHFRDGDFPRMPASEEEFLAGLIPVGLAAVTSPGEEYLWRPSEEFMLGAAVYGRVYSRSTWARIGVEVRAADDWFSEPRAEFHGRPWCTLTTYAPVELRTNDAIAQVIFNDCRFSQAVTRNQIQELLSGGKLKIRRGGRRVWDAPDGVPLTMDDHILLYVGGALRPGADAFERRRIPRNGLLLPRGAFFLSSSREYVEIPEEYVGQVDGRLLPEYWKRFGAGSAHILSQSSMPPYTAHPNAPYIGPKSVFRGKITFENRMRFEGMIYPKMPLSTLFLERLTSSAEGKSRYDQQRSVTASRS